MNKNIAKVLNKIEENGFEAYVVGGYVRDYVLGIESTDIDICTNALPKDLMEIFDNYNSSASEYGAIKIITSTYNYDITTFRTEKDYHNRRPNTVEYVNELAIDLKRRDFTINTLCMDSNGNIIDLLNAKEDINNKIIRGIGNIKKKFIEDPLRMLRALRFATTLDFNLEDEIIAEIVTNKELISTLSSSRIKYEMDCILSSTNAIKGLNLMKSLGVLQILGIDYNEIIYVNDRCGMYSQLTIENEYPFTKSELHTIKEIKEIVSNNKLDNETLFNYDLYTLIVAGNILGYNTKYINELYEELPIKKEQEINITSIEICDLLSIKPCGIIKNVKDEIRHKILQGTLINDNNLIKEFIINNREKWLYERNAK